VQNQRFSVLTVFLLVFAGIFLFLTTFEMYERSIESRHSMSRDLEYNARLFSNMISLVFHELAILSRYTANNMVNKDMTSDNTYDVLIPLNEMASNNSVYWDAVFWVPSHVEADQLLCSRCGGKIDKYFVEAIKNRPNTLQISPTLINCEFDRKITQAAIGVVDKSGIYLGALFFAINLDEIYLKIAGALNLSAKYKFFISDNEKIFIFQNEDKKEKFKLSPVEIETIHRNASALEVGEHNILMPLLSFFGVGSSMIIYHFPDLPYHIGIIYNNDNMFFLGYDALKLFAHICIVLVSLIAGLFVLWHIISLPLRELTKASKCASDGKATTISMPDSNILELHDLYQSFKKLIIQCMEFSNTSDKLSFLKQYVDVIQKDKSEFMKGVQHRLRTPLYHVISSADILQKKIKELPAEEQKENLEYISIITNASKELLSTINNMIAVTELNAGSLLFENRPFKLQTLLKEVVDELTLMAEQQKVKITMDIEIGIPKLIGDVKMLKIAFTNLIGNAIIHQKDKGKIFIMARLTMSGVKLSIRDKGYGIPIIALQNIKHNLHKKNVSFSSKIQKSVGMGLLIAYTIFERHDAVMDIDNNSDGGLTVTIHIPNIHIKYNTIVKKGT
jgi:signal transduction histidine kinase